MTTDNLKTLFSLTFREPQAAARQLISMNPPLSVRWMGALLTASLSGLLAWMTSLLFPAPSADVLPTIQWITSQPLLMASLHLLPILMLTSLMFGVGRMFGGTGSFEDALLLTVWIEFVLLLVQVVQVVLTLVMPGLAGIFIYATLGLFVWITVQFTKELHGFTSGAKVFLGLVVTAFVMAALIVVLAINAGVVPELPQ